MKSCFVIIFAVVLDVLLGDPFGKFHIVVLQGGLVNLLEKCATKLAKNNITLFICGFILWGVVCFLCFLGCYFTLKAFYHFSFYLGFVLEVFICYECLAARSLHNAATKVQKSLVNNEPISKTRVLLSGIVGRDTDTLEKPAIIKATVETVAENTTDALVAPLFFMFIFGTVGAVVFKAISTMDSMIGYHDKKYEFLGKVAARMDDVANFIPARLTSFFMLVTCFCLFRIFNAKGALTTFIKDRYKSKSPNAGLTEAIAAGALGIRLLGPAIYKGVLENKQYIGVSNSPPAPCDIKKALILMWGAYSLCFFVGIGLKSIL